MSLSFGQFRQEAVAGDKDIEELKNYATFYNRNGGEGSAGVMRLDVDLYGGEKVEREGEDGDVEGWLWSFGWLFIKFESLFNYLVS